MVIIIIIIIIVLLFLLVYTNNNYYYHMILYYDSADTITIVSLLVVSLFLLVCNNSNHYYHHIILYHASTLCPVSVTRFPLRIFSPGAGLLIDPFFTLSTLRLSRGWVRKDGNLLMETGCTFA